MATVLYSTTTRMATLTDYAGVVTGTLASNAARQANRAAIQTAIDDCAANNKTLIVPKGTYEIHNAGLVVGSGFRWLGTMESRIVQYSLNLPVLHVGAALGATGQTVENTIIDGVYLRYSGTATAGGNALELNGAYMCTFKNIQIGDVQAPFSSRTSVPYIGVYCDDAAGTTPCFSCTWETIRIKHFGYRGFSADRLNYEAATGNVFTNVYIAGGNSAGKQDTSSVAGSAALLLGSQAQAVFNQLNIEWITTRRVIEMVVCDQTVFTGVNLEGITLKASSSQDIGFFDLYNGSVTVEGLTVNDCTMSAANNVARAGLFRIGPDSVLSYNNVRPLLMTSTVPFYVVLGNAAARSRVDCGTLMLGNNDDITGFDASFSLGLKRSNTLVSSVGQPTALIEPFGLCTHQNEATQHYSKWVEAGVQWIRFDIPWDELEPTQGTYLWANWDTAISTANSLGLKVLLVLGYTPSWANGGNAHNYSQLVGFDDEWQAYVSAVTTRYAASVSAWEVWNEPDLDQFHHAHSGDWAYTNYAGESTADKNRLQYKHTVDLAMQAGVAGKYLTTSGMAEGGGNDTGMRPWLVDRRGWYDQFDVASFHCYGYSGGTISGASFDRLQNIPNDYRAVQDGGGFEWPGGFWITEHGVTNGSNTDADDKTYLIRSYALALSQARVKKLFWFRGGYDPNHRDMLNNSSVRQAVFYAYQTLTGFWGKAVSIRRWSSGNAQGAIATLLSGARVAIVWLHGDAGAGMPINSLGLSITACFDQDGGSIASSTTLTARPVFVTLSD